MTPREFQALTEVWREDREFQISLYAGLQATLHNAHFRVEEGQPPFTAKMFMPDYVPPKYDWRSEQKKFRLIGRKPQSHEERRANQELISSFKERAQRMDEARARGASSQELQAIMEDN